MVKQGLKKYLSYQQSEVLIEFILDKKNQTPDIVDEIAKLIMERKNKEDMVSLASIVKGSNLEKIKRIAIERKDIDFIVKLAMIPNMNWKDLEESMLAIFLEKKEHHIKITNEELYMATIFYKNVLDADISRIESIMLESRNYSAMACFASNVPRAHIEKFEWVIIQTGCVQVLRKWKELVKSVSPNFNQALERLELEFKKNINELQDWVDHKEEADERWQTVERISSEILSPKEAEQHAKSSHQKRFPFWKRK